jgi:hypothetical protein
MTASVLTISQHNTRIPIALCRTFHVWCSLFPSFKPQLPSRAVCSPVDADARATSTSHHGYSCLCTTISHIRIGTRRKASCCRTSKALVDVRCREPVNTGHVCQHVHWKRRPICSSRSPLLFSHNLTAKRQYNL